MARWPKRTPRWPRLRILHDWDWQGAEQEFQRALELNPNFAQAHHWYGNLLLGPEGRHDEAIAELRRAQELDPLSLIINADVPASPIIWRVVTIWRCRLPEGSGR
jgi:tetratricopeptide (TPR) repeat protein